ncbi:NUDIX hydrolase [Ornithinibacillus sp. 179-J 7C1 HS]|uniref:NUDIX hydrolase n=1 Tax=Ornithinibacillus sp. 179-J 7C1 HS TaxID=3142384 RepID=UPI0039A048C4
MGYIEELRALVGNKPLILVGTAIGVINNDGEILLQKRGDGRFGVPGGFLELGESAEEAGRREVLEETGIEIGELELVTVISGKEHFVKLPNGDEFYSVTIVYSCRDIIGGDLKADGTETVEAKFFKPSELPDGLNPLLKQLISSLSISYKKSN